MAEEAAKEGRKIMVAVDGGDESMHALSWCLKNVIGKNPDDTLLLLHAKPPRAVYATPMPSTGGFYDRDVVAAMENYSIDVAEGIMEKAMKICVDFRDDLLVEIIVENGEPKDVICEAAEKLAPDLLVMGSHGRGLIRRTFLGSVSNHCAQNVKCPVLLVKKPKMDAAAHS